MRSIWRRVKPVRIPLINRGLFTPPSGIHHTPHGTRLVFLFSLLCLSGGVLLLLTYALRSTSILTYREGLYKRIWDLFILIVFLFSAGSLGCSILRWTRFQHFGGWFHVIFSVAIGLTAYYVVGLTLAMAQLLYTPVLAACLLGFVLISWGDNDEFFRLLRVQCSQLKSSSFGITATILGGLYLALALSPPAWDDALGYHLLIPAQYLENHGVTRETDNIYRLFPPAMSTLYMFLMGLGSDMLPKLLHGFFGVITIGLLYLWSLRISNRTVATIATLLFASQWTIQHGMERANVDFHFAFYSFAAFVVIFEIIAKSVDSKRFASLCFVTGILVGTALSAKLQAVSSLVAMEVFLLGLVILRRLPLKCLVLFHVATGAVYLPTLVRNLIYTGDPIALYFPGVAESLFHMSPLEVNRFEKVAMLRGIFTPNRTLVTFFMTPLFAYWDGWFPSINFDGFVDPFYLLTVPTGLYLLKTHSELRWSYLYLFSYYVCWWGTHVSLRYALPILPLLSFISVYTLFELANRSGITFKRPFRSIAMSLIYAFAWINIGNIVLQKGDLLGTNIKGFLEAIDRNEYYEKLGSIGALTSKIGKEIRKHEGPGNLSPQDSNSAKVFSVFLGSSYGLGRRMYNDPFCSNLLMLEEMHERGEDVPSWLRNQGYRYIVLDNARIPWMLNRSYQNRYINPTPIARKRLLSALEYWFTVLRPTLLPLSVRAHGALQLYVIKDDKVKTADKKDRSRGEEHQVGGGDHNQRIIVFVVLDAVRADHTSLCGYKRPTTPFLQELQKDKRFSVTCQAYSPGSWTLPSHASFFTGLSVEEHGAHMAQQTDSMFDWGVYANPLSEEHLTLAEIYRDRGYSTVLVSSNPVVGRETGLSQGFEIQYVAVEFEDWYRDNYMRQFESAMEKARSREKPIFLFLNIADAHSPWKEVPDGLPWIDARPELIYRLKDDPFWGEYADGKADKATAKSRLEWYKDVYDYGIHSADKVLSQVLQRLEDYGYSDYSLIITSDHGEQLGENQATGHGVTVWEPNVRVPLLIRRENRAPPALNEPFATQHLFDLLKDGNFGNETPPYAVAGPDKSWQKYSKNYGSSIYVAFWEKNRKWIWKDYEVFTVDDYSDRYDDEMFVKKAQPGGMPEEYQATIDEVIRSFHTENEPGPEMYQKMKALGYVK